LYVCYQFGSFEDRAEEFFLEPKDLDCSASTDSSLFKVLKIKHKEFQYEDDMRTGNICPRSIFSVFYKLSVPTMNIQKEALKFYVFVVFG
jgi:hypothetical protein